MPGNGPRVIQSTVDRLRPLSLRLRYAYVTFTDGTKTLVRDKRDRAITCVFCRDLHITPMFFGPF